MCEWEMHWDGTDLDELEDVEDTVAVFREALVSVLNDIPKEYWHDDIPADPPIRICVDPNDPSVILHTCSMVGCPNAFDPENKDDPDYDNYVRWKEYVTMLKKKN